MLNKLADAFLKLSQQTNLFAPKHKLHYYLEIPKVILPRLHALSNGKGSGSDMDIAISRLRDSSNEGHKFNYSFSAVVLTIEGKNKKPKIIGWALVGKETDKPSPLFMVDLFVDPNYRRFSFGSLLKAEAIKYGQSLGYTYEPSDHFEYNRVNLLSPSNKKEHNRTLYLKFSLKEAEQSLLEHRQALSLKKPIFNEDNTKQLTEDEIRKGIVFWQDQVQKIKQ
jgi:GNAT superfamily N-acetyltransferase